MIYRCFTQVPLLHVTDIPLTPSQFLLLPSDQRIYFPQLNIFGPFVHHQLIPVFRAPFHPLGFFLTKVHRHTDADTNPASEQAQDDPDETTSELGCSGTSCREGEQCTVETRSGTKKE